METKFFKNLLAATAIAMSAGFMFTACGDDDPEPETPQLVLDAENLFAGTTLTWPVDDPSSVYTAQRASTYNVVFNDDKSTASIVITDADFLNGMPALDPMTFPGISYLVTGDHVTLQCEALIPEIGGRPFSAFPISDVDAKLVPEKSLILTFICDYRGTPYVVSFNGTPVK